MQRKYQSLVLEMTYTEKSNVKAYALNKLILTIENKILINNIIDLEDTDRYLFLLHGICNISNLRITQTIFNTDEKKNLHEFRLNEIRLYLRLIRRNFHFDSKVIKLKIFY